MENHLTSTPAQREFLATITSKGQVTIPAGVRRLLGLKEHDKIAFVLGKQGNITLQAPQYPTLASLKGAAGKLEKPLPWKEMQRIAWEDRMEEHAAKQP